MKTIFNFLILLLLIQPFRTSGQKKLDFGGHLQNLNTVWIQDLESEWYSVSSIYNRLNLKWYLHQNITFTANVRNVLNFGQLIYMNYPIYSEMLVRDVGLFDLTADIASDSSYILYTNLDRLNLKLTKGKLEAIAGRQRINWGINLVWNPNDIFNTFNYYDFDYLERPGCDALRFSYYTGISSSLETAVKIDNEHELTIAGMYKFNLWNYDFQLMSGIMTTDVVIGAGWAGNLKKAGFTGEVSWFRDRENFTDTLGILVLSTGINYTFRNSLYVHTSFLYTSNGTIGKAGVENPFLSLREVSPKSFTAARYSVFGQVSYPITPLISGDISAIFNPSDLSVFFAPNIGFSLSDNISLLLISQIFMGENGTEFGGLGSLIYIRLKWSF